MYASPVSEHEGEDSIICEQYVDRCGVLRDRHGPFWPQGFGPVCNALAPGPNSFEEDSMSFIGKEDSRFQLYESKTYKLPDQLLLNKNS
ncbi:unnamed protein product [Protopolystoma xenopodis]|uniref:Uncharacterized protein n=1 Tax=Protopolystoma xenopodis TaxID=117903 RepID=A0A3S5AW88_9PLAT|nr:unnamed protein product [Protopolystoma xenopodis]